MAQRHFFTSDYSMKENGTPLRYPGGKSLLATFIREILERNDLIGGTYVEPYAGGAGAAIKLLQEGSVSKVILNDLSPLISAFWLSITKRPGLFMERFEKTEVTIEEWHRQKEIAIRYREFSRVEVGFATFFLNRCNRSGVLNAGPIGGKNQEGNYKLNARYNKESLRARLERIIGLRKQIEFSSKDALDFLVQLDDLKDDRVLVYLDPPYYVKGAGLYLNAYEHQNHEELEYFLRVLKQPWMLSYDNVEEIQRIYKTYPQYCFSLSYRVNKVKTGSEFLTHSRNLHLPPCLIIRRSSSKNIPIERIK